MKGGSSGSTTEPRGPDDREDRRAASEVIGVVLLFGLVLVGVVLIALSGSSAVDQVQQQSEYSSAEVSMQELKTGLTNVVQDTSQERTNFQMGDGRTDDMRVMAGGHMNFSLNGNTSCFAASREIGTVRYNASDGRELAYQANAVFQKDGDNTEIVSQPGLSYRETMNDNGYRLRTISFELANINPNTSEVQGTDFTARPSRDGRSLNLLECSGDFDGDGTNETRQIDWVNNITIEVSGSPYYQGWAEFFRNEFEEGLAAGGTLSTNPTTRTVRVTVPLGIANDDDNDGVPDPNTSAAFPNDGTGDGTRYFEESNYENYARSVADNCPPPPAVEEPPGSSIKANYTNYNQVDSGGTSGVGDLCDTSGAGGGGGGGGGGATPDLKPNVRPPNAVVDAGNSVVLAASATDPDPSEGSISSWNWTPSGSLAPANGTLNSAYGGPNDNQAEYFAPSSANVPPGGKIVEIPVEATDDEGNTVTRTATVFVKNTTGTGSAFDQPPNAIVENETALIIEEGQTVDLNASGSYDPDDTGLAFNWSTDRSDSGVTPRGGERVTYDAPANVSGYVIDRAEVVVKSNGKSDTATIPVVVYDPVDVGGSAPSFNVPPTAVAAADDRIALTTSGDDTETLNASLSVDPDGSITDYNWSITSGPGNISGGASELATYNAPDSLSGSATVRIELEVRDDGGANATDTVVISVFNGTTVADSDGDGVPDNADDCPGFNGTGVNGCQPITRSGNAIRVNQNGGQITYVDSMISKKNESTDSRKPLDVMFVLDGTGSMDRNDPSQERVDAAQKFIGQLNSSKDRVGWTEFRVIGSDCQDTGYWDDPEPSECATLQQGLTSNFAVVNSSIANVHDRGSTYIGAGIEKTVSEFQSSSSSDRKKVMVLLSDGANYWCDVRTRFRCVRYQFAESTLNDWTAANATKASAENISIYTVNLADGDRNLLKNRIAEPTGGNYTRADDASELEETFLGIAEDIKDPVKRIEYQQVSGTVNVDNTKTINFGTYVHDPTTAPGTTFRDLNFSAGSLISLSATAYQCSGVSDTGADWKDFNQTQCNRGSPLWTVDNSTDNHKIFLDGDSLSRVPSELNNMRPWERNFTEVVNNYDPTAIEGGQFNLSPNEAYFLVQMPNDSARNYAVMHFKANDSDRDYCAGGADCVNATGAAPKAIATASDYEVNASETVSLDGTQSYDPNGTIVDYQWTKVSGNGTITNPNSATPTYQAPSDPADNGSTVKIRLKVTDNSTQTDRTTITIGIAGNGSSLPGTGPEAVATADDGVVVGSGDENLSASNSYDPDGSITRYNWTLLEGSGRLVDDDTATPEFEASPPASDTVKVRLKVTDDDGNTDTTTMSFTQVTASTVDNRSPTAIATADDYEVDAGSGNTETLYGDNSTDPDGDSLTYSWTLSGPGRFASGGTSTTGARVDYEPPASPGSDRVATITLTVDDGDQTSTDTIKIGVNATATGGTGGAGGKPPDNGYVVGIGGGEITIGGDDDS